MYCIHYYDNNKTLPEINKDLINTIMKLLCKDTDSRGRKPRQEIKDLKKKLGKFYDSQYSKTIHDKNEKIKLYAFKYGS